MAPVELEKMKDCSWRNRFNSSKSSSYKKDGKDFNVSLSAVADVAGFIGIDTVTVSIGTL